MQSYYFFKTPIIKEPPMVQLPDPTQSRDWYGEIFVTYPAEGRVFATCFGHNFKAIAELRVVMSGIALQAFQPSSNINKLSLQMAQEYQSKLSGWYNKLPELLSPTNIVWPSRLKIQ